MNSHRAGRAIVAAAFGLVLGGGDACAQQQNHVVGFGVHVFDSSWNDGPYVRVFAGWDFTLALRPDGTLAAWGHNDARQTRVPALPPGVTYVAADGGDGDGYWNGAHGVALRSDGVVVGWGGGTYTPAPAPPPPPGVVYVEVDALVTATLLRRSDGVVITLPASGDVMTAVPTTASPFVEVAAAGWHATGRLADGTLISWEADWTGTVTLLPVPPPPSGAAFVEIAAGSGGHDAARLDDGTVVAWGANGDGQCNVPPAPAGTSYVQIACGHRHTLARRSDGAVVAWGWNAAGQCDVPSPPAGLTYVDIAAGYAHSVALRSDGAMIAWGSNSDAQCNVPRPPSGIEYVGASACGFFVTGDYWGTSETMLLRSDGALISLEKGAANIPTLPTGAAYVAAAGGAAERYALRSDGALVAWGGSTPAPTGNVYARISAGPGHAAALRNDGTVTAWGRNDVGQCNVPNPPFGRVYVDVAANSFDSGYPSGHTVALRDDGAAVVAGSLGPAPALPPGVKYAQVAAGHFFAAARRDDGEVVVWRDSADPLLGYVDLTPPACPPGMSYAEVAAGAHHVVARRSDGALVAWGWNGEGELDVPTIPVGFGCFAISAAGAQSVGMFRRLPLAFLQPNGAGTGVSAALGGLVAGHEYYNLYSFTPASNGPGTGPWLGLWFDDLGFLVQQILLPPGDYPFHFVADAPLRLFGPYALPSGTVFDAVRFDFTGGSVGSVSPVVRFVVD